jgi:minor extracellular serine protease Vpr
VPYAGFKGDYQSITVLTPTANGFPWLSRFDGATFFKVPAASNVFSFTDNLNVPHFLVHFDHQARSLTGDVYRVSDNKWMGTGIVDEFLPRNSTAGAFFDFPWDGNAKKGQGSSDAGPVADGTYYMEFTLIKALGTKAQAESWTSPDFVIDRP